MNEVFLSKASTADYRMTSAVGAETTQKNTGKPNSHSVGETKLIYSSMKKIFVMLVVFVGLGICANAQTCPIPGTYESISVTNFEKTTGSAISDGYWVTVSNPSNKKVSFKIIAKNPENIKEKVLYGKVDGKKGKEDGSAKLHFKPARKESDFNIDDIDIQVTSCSD